MNKINQMFRINKILKILKFKNYNNYNNNNIRINLFQNINQKIYSLKIYSKKT